MGLVSLALVCGLVLGLLAGGRLAELGRLPVAGAELLVLALALQVVGVLTAQVLPAGPTWGAAMLASGLLVAAFLVRKRAVAGTALIALGMLANALVILANGAMPVSAYAAERSGAGAAAVADRRHEPATADSRLMLLADVVPVPLPLRPEVDSVGDLLVAAGIGQLVFGAVRPRRRRGAKLRTPGRPRRRRGPDLRTPGRPRRWRGANLRTPVRRQAPRPERLPARHGKLGR